MSHSIAFSGKGGVGKTTLAALTVRALVEAGQTPVLAIDADPNSCLDASLGVEVVSTIGRAREKVREEADEAKLSKQELLRMKIAQGLVEARGFDLIAMGRPEGAGCYCYANNVLRDAIRELSGQYPRVVLDNEAGLENLSRRIVQEVDVLVLVSDAGSAGLNTLKRLYDLAKEMEVKYRRLALAVNRTRDGVLPDGARDVRAYTGADAVVALPYDEEIAKSAEDSASVWGLSDGNPVYGAVRQLILGDWGA